MKKPDIDKISLRMEAVWTSAEQRIMEDVVRRIQKAGKVTSTADYQINRLIELGKSTEEIEKIIQEALGATLPEMYELYDEAANWQYVRNRDVYEQVNARFVPPEDNGWLKETSMAVKEQTSDQLRNLAKSYGFSVMMGNRRVFMPFADYWHRYVDEAIMDVISGGFDYNTVIRRVVTQMTNSGLRVVDYASGHTNRVDVAARRAVMTGLFQITGKINEQNAKDLGTEYFEVTWHEGARPDHRRWQGKVYSRKELESICGLGSVAGLCGANCRHEYYPFVKGISERLYSDEWLKEQDEKEDKTKEWNGKQLNAYERTQQQRKMETAMRAQREKVDLLKEAGVDPDEITIARAKYQGQLDEYKRYCKKMGLPEQRERIYYDMRGRVAPGKIRTSRISKIKKETAADFIDVEIMKEMDTVVAANVYKNLNKSDTGKAVLDFICKNKTSVNVYYNEGTIADMGLEGLYGQAIGNHIYINGRATQSIQKTSETIIHEATHIRLDIGHDQHAEAVCDYYAKLHTKGSLTGDDIRDIIKSVKKRYPEYRWRRGT